MVTTDIKHPEDIGEIRRFISTETDIQFSNDLLEHYYICFSRWMRNTDWLPPTTRYLKDFVEWLRIRGIEG